MYEFKQAVKVNFEKSGKPESQTFIRGRHNVSAEVEASDDFLHFVNCGWIAEIDPAKAPVPLETFAERSQRLAKKLAEKKAATEPVREPVQPDGVVTGEKPDGTLEVELTDGTKAEVPPDAQEEDPGAEVPEEKLTPAQKAARTRAANKAKAEKGE